MLSGANASQTDLLRREVGRALHALGNAFLDHPDNTALRAALDRGTIPEETLYRELLYLVYRVLFLYVALDRVLLDRAGRTGPQSVDPRALISGADGCSRDAWARLRAAFSLMRPDGRERLPDYQFLKLSLFGCHGCPLLESCSCHDAVIVETMRSLAGMSPGSAETRWDFRSMPLETLGHVYESMVGYCVRIDLRTCPVFRLLPGPERKRSGTYYTPSELVEELIRTALDPMIEERRHVSSAPGLQVPALTVCDPACGFGHFLLAAGRRIAGQYPHSAAGGAPRSPAHVVATSLYGVDRDRLAVDLCRAALWLEAGDPVMPVEVLHDHVKCGDALVGIVRPPTKRPTARPARSTSSPVLPHFDWPAEFPVPFSRDGFDVVLSNPPWELLQPQEVEFFSMHGRPDIACLPGRSRKDAIGRLQDADPGLFGRWLAFRAELGARRAFVRRSGRFPLTGRGRLNTYALFVETIRAILAPQGLAGCLVPSGIATDENTSPLFRNLVDTSTLLSLYHFDNRRRLFSSVSGNVTFCLLTISGTSRRCAAPRFAFYLHSTQDLLDAERRVSLTPRQIATINPNTRCLPVFRTRRDAQLGMGVAERIPPLRLRAPIDANPWGLSFRQGLFNMTSDSHLFHSPEPAGRKGGSVPLFEAKMIHHYDHCRWRPERGEPSGGSLSPSRPRYTVAGEELERRLGDGWKRDWMIGCRLVCRGTDSRTVISTVIPRVACGNSILVLFPSVDDARLVAALVGCLSSFSLDYFARAKLGGSNLNFHILEQLPVLPPRAYAQTTSWSGEAPVVDWLLPRLLELIYTSPNLRSFARDCGYTGATFRWDTERRFHLRCELDAAYFHLYGLNSRDVSYILDTFEVVRRAEERAFAEFRTKRVVLELHRAMEAG